MAMDSARQRLRIESPNFSALDYPGVVFKIAPDYTYSLFTTLPAPPQDEAGAPDGDVLRAPTANLYIGDNHYTQDKDYQSRILRVNMQDGKPQGVDVVAKGLKHPQCPALARRSALRHR